MQFFLHSDLRHNQHIRALLIIFQFFCLSFLFFNIFLEAQKTGLRIDTILISLRGDSAQFLPPKDWSSLLTDLHINLFIYPLLIISVFSILVHTPLSIRAKTWSLLASSLGVLLDTLGVLGTRFLHAWWVGVKILGFWIFEISLIFMTFQIFIYLFGRTHSIPQAKPGWHPHG